MRRRRLIVSLRALDDLSASIIASPNSTRRPPGCFWTISTTRWYGSPKTGVTGTPRAFLPGLRAFPYRNRVIYFVVTVDKLTVLRVAHGAQNITPDDFTESIP